MIETTITIITRNTELKLHAEYTIYPEDLKSTQDTSYLIAKAIQANKKKLTVTNTGDKI